MTAQLNPEQEANDQSRLLQWRPLRYFVAVAEELHFGRAAERLDIAQQSLSAQIQKLERALGCQLLTRAANRVELTPAGDVFLLRARRILAEIDVAVDMTRRAALGESGVVRFGHCSAALRHVLPATVRALKVHYPELRITTREMRGSDNFAHSSVVKLTLLSRTFPSTAASFPSSSSMKSVSSSAFNPDIG